LKNHKKAIDLGGFEEKTKEYISELDDRFKPNGTAGDIIPEPLPHFLTTKSEKVYSQGNAYIVLGKDRSGSRISGYGGKGDTQCSSIDIVVGRIGAESKKINQNNEQLWCDPDFKRDTARIYISQKADIDEYFDLTEGKVGNSKVRSAIGLKADAVRIIAREGIKLVTGGDLKNSQGGEVISIKGIDLIAGNDDEDLQPMAKGDNLVEALERLTFHIDSLVGAVDAMLMIQYDYNATIQNHWHISPYFSAPTTPSQTVSIKGTKAAIDYLTKVKTSLVNIKKNLAAFKITYLSSAGQKYVLSRWNNTN